LAKKGSEEFSGDVITVYFGWRREEGCGGESVKGTVQEQIFFETGMSFPYWYMFSSLVQPGTRQGIT
jgi:hypothetical protein